jgi:hypothetical protein
MKKLFLIAVLIIMGISFQTKAQNYYDRGYDNDGFGYFYTSLSPYGMWIEFGDGVYGWRPFNMRSTWAPYANGQWIWTADGWYWDSYEPFGYIVYHYGRWYYDSYYGWVWIPDYQWAPAWVEWRYDNDYIGWTPLPPYAVFSVSIGIHFTHVFYTPYSHWHFVKYRYFCDPYVGKYFVGAKYKYRIYSGTKYRHDYGYRNGRVINRGVDVNIIRQRGKINIRERTIRTVSDLRDINSRDRVTNTEVRTFIPDRKSFSGAKVRDMKIERTSRNTTLETSKLEFGRKNIQREAPGRSNNTGNREIKKDNSSVRTERNATGGNVNQKRSTEQKRVVPNTGTKSNDRKEIKRPVQKTPERKDARSVTTGRTQTQQKVESKSNDSRIKNSDSRTQTRSYTPPVQKRTERSVNTSRGNSKNSNVQSKGNKGSERTKRR